MLHLNTGVQSINNVFHIIDKVENGCVNKYIFDRNDNVEYVVYALYFRIAQTVHRTCSDSCKDS